jgi:hypothetical protein
MLHITRASSDGVCFCDCKDCLMAVPDQLDCPWCGCGWLLTCDKCGKAFTFGKVVEIDADLDDLIRADLAKRGYSKRDVKEFAGPARELMDIVLSDLEKDVEYVYLDGVLIPIDAEGPIEFEGMHSRHWLDSLPHLGLRSDPDALAGSLADPEYWESRRLEEEDE